MKIIRTVLLFLVIVLAVIGVYWYFIHPNTYKYNTAVKNGDVVMGPDGLMNADKLDTFMNHVGNKQPDKIRITVYTKEGYPIIYDLKYDGIIIKCTTDNTRNRFGRQLFKSRGEYTKIIKDNGNNYILVDETGKYKDQGIFQD